MKTKEQIEAELLQHGQCRPSNALAAWIVTKEYIINDAKAKNFVKTFEDSLVYKYSRFNYWVVINPSVGGAYRGRNTLDECINGLKNGFLGLD